MINRRWGRKHGKVFFHSDNNNIYIGTSSYNNLLEQNWKWLDRWSMNSLMVACRWPFNVITLQSTTLVLCDCRIPNVRNWRNFLPVADWALLKMQHIKIEHGSWEFYRSLLFGDDFLCTQCCWMKIYHKQHICFWTMAASRKIPFIDSVVKVRNLTRTMRRVKFIRITIHRRPLAMLCVAPHRSIHQVQDLCLRLR